MNVRPFIATLLGMTPEEFDLALLKIIRTVTDFFTETIPGVWREAVTLVEGFYASLADFIDKTMNKIYDVTVGTFNRTVNKAKGILSEIPGVSSLLDLETNVAPATSGVAASGFARAQAASVFNRNRTTRSININSPININQLPGANNTDLARQVRDVMSRDVRRAVQSADSGRDI